MEIKRIYRHKLERFAKLLVWSSDQVYRNWVILTQDER